jgi:hypothetical protein
MWLSEGLRAQVHRLVDARCAGSHIVILNGAYAPSLSNITSIADRITIDGADLIAINDDLPEGVKDSVRRMATFLPDTDEAPRNSFGSSYIGALTMVRSSAVFLTLRACVCCNSSFLDLQANCLDTQCILVPDQVDVDVPLQVLVCHAQMVGRGEGQEQGQGQERGGPDADSLGGHLTASLSSAADGAAPTHAEVRPHTASYPSLLVLLGRGARLELLQAHHTILLPSLEEGPVSAQEPQAFVAATTRLALAEGAALVHSYLQEAAGG